MPFLKNKTSPDIYPEDQVGFLIDLEAVHNFNSVSPFYNKTPYKLIEKIRKKINKKHGNIATLFDKILNNESLNNIIKDKVNQNITINFITSDIFKTTIPTNVKGGKSKRKQKTKRKKKSNSIKQYTNNGWVVIKKRRKTRKRRSKRKK